MSLGFAGFRLCPGYMQQSKCRDNVVGLPACLPARPQVYDLADVQRRGDDLHSVPACPTLPDYLTD
jgi:hypothetical protein